MFRCNTEIPWVMLGVILHITQLGQESAQVDGSVKFIDTCTVRSTSKVLAGRQLSLDGLKRERMVPAKGDRYTFQATSHDFVQVTGFAFFHSTLESFILHSHRRAALKSNVYAKITQTRDGEATSQSASNCELGSANETYYVDEHTPITSSSTHKTLLLA
jgi:hypothetical protein